MNRQSRLARKVLRVKERLVRVYQANARADLERRPRPYSAADLMEYRQALDEAARRARDAGLVPDSTSEAAARSTQSSPRIQAPRMGSLPEEDRHTHRSGVLTLR
jgi:hypothetical protein